MKLAQLIPGFPMEADALPPAGAGGAGFGDRPRPAAIAAAPDVVPTLVPEPVPGQVLPPANAERPRLPVPMPPVWHDVLGPGAEVVREGPLPPAPVLMPMVSLDVAFPELPVRYAMPPAPPSDVADSFRPAALPAPVLNAGMTRSPAAPSPSPVPPWLARIVETAPTQPVGVMATAGDSGAAVSAAPLNRAAPVTESRPRIAAPAPAPFTSSPVFKAGVLAVLALAAWRAAT